MSSIIKGLISELNPDLKKHSPADSDNLEEDGQGDLGMALSQARKITKAIKYDDTATDIIVQIQMLAEKYNIDKDALETAIDEVYNAKNKLEAAVYGLDEVFADALKQSRWDDDEVLDENLRKWFKEKWVRFGPDGKIRGACARGDDSEGKPKCLPQSKAHSLGKKGRASAAARKRREDPNPERSGKAINVATKKKSNESEIDEACWKGYHKEGNKKMFGKTYPNCVKNTNEEEQLDEKCWDTHKQVGMKSKGGRMVPNCVPKESVEEGLGDTSTEVLGTYKGWKFAIETQAEDDRYVKFYGAVSPEGKWHSLPKRATADQFKQFVDSQGSVTEEKCPHCSGPMFEASLMNEKKDACYYKVKSRYKVWPSAYASGALVKCRKKGASNWGNKSESVEEGQIYSTGGGAGQSYRKYKVKPSGIAQGIEETEAVNRNDGDGWRWTNIKPSGT